jgi:hypothetical protein
VLHAETDLTPGGDQSYTECSWHEFNSGAVLKFYAPRKQSFETGSIMVSVLTEDALGDCDGGGLIDADELALGTDPHDPADDPCTGFNDICIDADGTFSSGRGISTHAEVIMGATLTSWPTGFYVEGIDWFDNDGTCTWSFGDDIHVEGPAYPTALRDALHDNNASFFDPVVLDLDLSLVDGQQVDVDLESGTTFTGCPGVDPLLKFYDASGNGFWDDGEDIIHDLNNNGIFD